MHNVPTNMDKRPEDLEPTTSDEYRVSVNPTATLDEQWLIKTRLLDLDCSDCWGPACAEHLFAPIVQMRALIKDYVALAQLYQQLEDRIRVYEQVERIHRDG